MSDAIKHARIEPGTGRVVYVTGSPVGTPLNESPGGSHPVTVADPVATKAYVGTAIEDLLPTTGGTMTGPLTLASAPDDALHAATKAYVDAATNTVISTVGAWAGLGVPVVLAAPTSLLAANHGGRLLVLTDSGNQMSLTWGNTGAGFSCSITNLTSYYCMPALTGFTEALVRGADLGIKPGGTAVLYCLAVGDSRLAFLAGAIA